MSKIPEAQVAEARVQWNRLEVWQLEASALQRRAEDLTKRIHDRAWKIAASVGIPRDGCCLHNASIDDKMTGWCSGRPDRLPVAKLASRILADWSASTLARNISARRWNKYLCPPYCPSQVMPAPVINRHILFAQPPTPHRIP